MKLEILRPLKNVQTCTRNPIKNTQKFYTNLKIIQNPTTFSFLSKFLSSFPTIIPNHSNSQFHRQIPQPRIKSEEFATNVENADDAG